jgi:hypothetical protein
MMLLRIISKHNTANITHLKGYIMNKKLTPQELIASMITSDLDINNGLIEEMDEVSFTEWCKRQGFEGPCKECGEKGLKSDNPAIVKKANFYMNTVKP